MLPVEAGYGMFFNETKSWTVPAGVTLPTDKIPAGPGILVLQCAMGKPLHLMLHTSLLYHVQSLKRCQHYSIIAVLGNKKNSLVGSLLYYSCFAMAS